MTEQPAGSMSPLGEDPWVVLGRYLAGESPSSEADTVRRWLAEDPRRGELVESFRRSTELLAGSIPAGLDVEGALRKVHARLEEPVVHALAERTVKRGHWGTIGLRAAAAIALLLGAGVTWRAMQKSSAPAVNVAASRTYTTGVGKTDSIRLDDGSVAVLGPRSGLEVAAGYGKDARVVTLRGEAFFTVVHDEKRPFTVRAGDASIQDLGTAFAVRTDEPGEVRVVVTEGSVSLQGPDARQGTSKSRSVVVKAGDRASLGRDGEPTVERSAATADDLAWTRGRLLFENASLARVQSDLRRWYGVELRVEDSALGRRHLTASFAGEPVQQVLDVIGLALGARIERRGDTAFVRSK